MFDISRNPGPTPYRPILTSPHRAEIDHRLFTERHSTARVHRWLCDDKHVTNVTYASLNRYKHAQLALKTSDPEDVRRSEVKRDLKFLAEVVKRGLAGMKAGIAVRPTEAMRAIELRSQILAMFPDVSREREDVLGASLTAVIEAVKEVVSEEQLLAIKALLNVPADPSDGAA